MRAQNQPGGDMRTLEIQKNINTRRSVYHHEHGNEKQILCMNAHEENLKIAVVIDSGASEKAVSVVRFRHCGIVSSWRASRRHSSVSERHSSRRRSWHGGKFQMCRGFGQDKLQGSARQLILEFRTLGGIRRVGAGRVACKTTSTATCCTSGSRTGA